MFGDKLHSDGIKRAMILIKAMEERWYVACNTDLAIDDIERHSKNIQTTSLLVRFMHFAIDMALLIRLVCVSCRWHRW